MYVVQKISLRINISRSVIKSLFYRMSSKNEFHQLKNIFDNKNPRLFLS